MARPKRDVKVNGVRSGRADVGNIKSRDLRNCDIMHGQSRCCMCALDMGKTERGAIHSHDVYWCNGWILCGDHRYELRHGREPYHDEHPGYNSSPSNTYDDESYSAGGACPAPHTLGRVRHITVSSMQAYRAYLKQ